MCMTLQLSQTRITCLTCLISYLCALFVYWAVVVLCFVHVLFADCCCRGMIVRLRIAALHIAVQAFQTSPLFASRPSTVLIGIHKLPLLTPWIMCLSVQSIPPPHSILPQAMTASFRGQVLAKQRQQFVDREHKKKNSVNKSDVDNSIILVDFIHMFPSCSSGHQTWWRKTGRKGEITEHILVHGSVSGTKQIHVVRSSRNRRWGKYFLSTVCMIFSGMKELHATAIPRLSHPECNTLKLTASNQIWGHGGRRFSRFFTVPSISHCLVSTKIHFMSRALVRNWISHCLMILLREALVFFTWESQKRTLTTGFRLVLYGTQQWRN